jgi:hypothetical protein
MQHGYVYSVPGTDRAVKARRLLDPARQRQRSGQREPACKLRGREPAREFEQRQGVSLCLGQELVGDPLVQPSRDDRRQQRPRIGSSKTLDNQLRQTGEQVALFARGEQHHYRLGQQPSRHERHTLGGCPV